MNYDYEQITAQIRYHPGSKRWSITIPTKLVRATGWKKGDTFKVLIARREEK
jgi:hypothetical protein